MKTLRAVIWILLLPALLLSAGCHAKLCGQRVTICYHGPKDELHMLICYDGVHCPDPKKLDEARAELTRFVENGNAMLLDWPFMIDLTELRKRMAAGKEPPAACALSQAALRSIKITNLGRYRDFDGRIGAAQLVVVSNAKEFLRKLNGGVNEAITKEAPKPVPDDKWRRTHQGVLRAARDGHQWVSLEGHAFCIRFPVHPGEWARGKADFLFNALVEMIEQHAKEKDEKRRKDRLLEMKDEIYRGVQALTAAPFSFIQTADDVRIRLGDPNTPNTFRFRLARGYQPNLEELFAKLVPVRLDDVLAQRLLSDKEIPASSPLDALLTWGPAEEKVRVLVNLAESKDTDSAKAAIQRLTAFSRDWNEHHGIPAAPVHGNAPDKFLENWKQWYREMIRFPMPGKDPLKPLDQETPPAKKR